MSNSDDSSSWGGKSPRKEKHVSRIASSPRNTSQSLRWIKSRTQKLVVPLTSSSVRLSKRCGVRLTFDRVTGFRLPAALLPSKSSSSSNSKFEYSVHVSLFHTASSSFFGNTWVSKPLPLSFSSTSKSKNGMKDVKTLPFPAEEFVLFHTKVSDPACLAVIEIVIIERDPNSSDSSILGQYGCGWSFMPLFSMLADGSSHKPHKVQVYSGSPRALLFVDEHDGASEKWGKKTKDLFKEKLQEIEGCVLQFSFVVDDRVMKLVNLIRENELIGPGQVVYGLKPNSKGVPALAADPKASIRLIPTTDMYVNGIAVLLPVNWEEAVLEYLSVHKGFKMRSDVSGKFVLKVGPHNQRRNVSPKGWVEAKLKDMDWGGHPEYDRVLRCWEPLRVKGVPKDTNIAIAFQVEYQLNVQERQAPASFVIGCGLWLPFQKSKSEGSKKIILSNTHPKAAITRCPLELLLTTDLQCPFTDSSVFLPLGEQMQIAPKLGVYLALKPQRVRPELDREDNSDQDSVFSSSRKRRAHQEKKKKKNRKDSSLSSSDDGDDSEYNDESDLSESSSRSHPSASHSASSMASSHSSASSTSSKGLSEFDEDNDFAWAGSSSKSKHSRHRRKHRKKHRTERESSNLHILRSSGALPFREKHVNPVDVNDSLLARTLTMRMHNGSKDGNPAGTSSHSTTIEFDPERTSKSAPEEKRKQGDVSNVLNSSLTRASRTVLNQHGYFTDVVDHSKTASMDPQKALDIPHQDINIELRDRLKANEVTFQFAAFRHSQNGINCHRPSSVFFTFQFYTCLPTRTERMKLHAVETDRRGNRSETTAALSTPFVLTRADTKNRNSPSLALKYVIDTTTSDGEDSIQFAKYLYEKTLFINVWDGDSLLCLGVIAVPMRDLMRQGEKVVKVAKEYDVVTPFEGKNASGMEQVDIFRSTPGRGEVRGKVQLILTNYGLKGKGKPDQGDKQLTTFKNKENNRVALDWRLQHAYSRGQVETSNESPKSSARGNGGPSHRVLARPLAQVNPQLDNLIKVADSSSKRILHPSRRKHKNTPQIMDTLPIESDMVFTSNELSRLERTLDRNNRGQIPISVLGNYLNLDEILNNDTSKMWHKLKTQATINVATYRVFNDVDAENQGSVPPSEFKRIVQSTFPPGKDGLSRHELESISKTFKDSSRGVNYERFLFRVLNDEAADLESKLRRVLRKAWVKSGVTLKNAFRDHFDVNSDGMVERAELVQGLKDLGFDPNKSQIDLLLRRYGNGETLNFADFCAIAEKADDGSMKGDSRWEQMEISLDDKIRKIVLLAKEKGGVQLRDTFEHFDKNGDGQLSRQECQQGLAEIGVKVSTAEMESLFNKLDFDGDGVVHLEEFIAFITRGKPLTPMEKVRRIVLSAEKRGVEVKNTFQHLDKDGDSVITKEECTEGLRKIGVRLSSREADTLFNEMDLDKDGKVNWVEFVAFLFEKRPDDVERDHLHEDVGSGLEQDKWEKKLRKILARASKNSKLDLRTTFNHFDQDGTGQVTTKDFVKALRKLGFEGSQEEFQPMISKFDSNGDGKISYEEFISFAVNASPVSSPSSSTSQPGSPKIKTVDELSLRDMPNTSSSGKDDNRYSASQVLARLQKILRQGRAKGVDVKESFAFFDRSKNNRISSSDLEKGLETLNFTFRGPEELAEVMSFFDKNGDGTIDLDEFRAFLDSTLPEEDSLQGSLLFFFRENNSKIKRKCRRFDKDDDGTVSMQRFIRIVKECGWEGQVSEQDLEPYTSADKVDRVEYEKLGVDTIQTKLCKAIERALSKGIPVKEMLLSKDRSKTGKLNIANLHKFVVDLGFSILEDKKDTWVHGKEEQEVMSRQLARVNQLRRSRMIRSDKQGVFDDLVVASASPSHAEFSTQEAQFDIVRRFREGQKRELVGSLLRSSITKNVEIFPSFAKPSYFEVMLTNPYPHEERFKINMTDPELRCLTRGEEWRHYRDFVPVAWKGEDGDGMDSFQSPVEDEMITPETLELTLDPDETVSIPFVFMSFASGMCLPDQKSTVYGQPLPIRERTIPVRITSTRHGHTVQLVNVNVVPKQFVVDRVLHFNGVNNEYTKVAIRLRDMSPSEEIFVHTLDPNAQVQWRDAQVFIKYRASLETSGEFYVLLYRDPYHASLFAVWHVCVQPMQRLDFHGVVGQASSNEFIVKGDRFSRRVQCFSSCPGETELFPAETFQLVAGAFNKVQVVFRPLSQTAPGTTKQIKIHMVDVDSYELVSSWLVNATAALPDVTKTFQIELPLHQAAHKKIAYVNPWNEPRVFLVRTSDPLQVKPKQPRIEVAPKSKSYIRLWMAAVHRPMVKEVLVFVNDEDDQNEECLLIRVKFSEK